MTDSVGCVSDFVTGSAAKYVKYATYPVNSVEAIHKRAAKTESLRKTAQVFSKNHT